MMMQALGVPTYGVDLARCGRGISLVVADDGPLDRSGLLSAIDRAGIEATVTVFGNGFDLLDELTALGRDQLPDLLLLDLWCSELDSLCVLESMAGTPALQDLPVLMLAEATQLDERERAIVAGATYFEVRPRSFDRLVALAASLPARVAASRVGDPERVDELAPLNRTPPVSTDPQLTDLQEIVGLDTPSLGWASGFGLFPGLGYNGLGGGFGGFGAVN